MSRGKSRSRRSINQKIARPAESLREWSGLIEELETGLTERTEKLTGLREELERYSSLAEVEEGTARAMVKQRELAINRAKAAESGLSL